MTAVYEVRWQHPQACEVCDQLGLIAFSRVGYSNTGRGTTPEVSRLSSVIPCRQCTDADMLRVLLSRDVPTWTPGGVA